MELAKRGHKVMTISPRYDQYKGAWDTSVKVDALGKQVGYFHEHKKGVDRVFVDHPLFLAKVWGKTGSKLYGKTNGADFADNQERFAMFCKAALCPSATARTSASSPTTGTPLCHDQQGVQATARTCASSPTTGASPTSGAPGPSTDGSCPS